MPYGDQLAPSGMSNDDVVLREWCEYVEANVIPRLSDGCEWRWVAFQLERALHARIPQRV